MTGGAGGPGPVAAAARHASAECAAHALALVPEGEPRTLSELAEAVGVTPAEAAALVAGFEDHGLLGCATARER